MIVNCSCQNKYADKQKLASKYYLFVGWLDSHRTKKFALYISYVNKAYSN